MITSRVPGSNILGLSGHMILIRQAGTKDNREGTNPKPVQRIHVGIQGKGFVCFERWHVGFIIKNRTSVHPIAIQAQDA
jgi:hypothetical protein